MGYPLEDQLRKERISSQRRNLFPVRIYPFKKGCKKKTKKKTGRAELQIRRSTEDNSKIIFLIFQQKHML